MTLELKPGMRIQIKDLKFTVEEAGPPKNIPTWKNYTGEDNGKLVESLLNSRVTSCALLYPDDYPEEYLPVIQWRNYWWTVDGMRLDGITVLPKPQ